MEVSILLLKRHLVKELSEVEKAWIGALVAGEGSVGYMRGRDYLCGGRKNPTLGPGRLWYPRIRIEMYDEEMIRCAGEILFCKASHTTRGSWLVVRMGEPAIRYLLQMRKYMPGTRGAESDFIIASGSPVLRPVVDRYIRIFRRLLPEAPFSLLERANRTEEVNLAERRKVHV